MIDILATARWRVAAILWLVMVWPLAAAAENWPQWRGPQAVGVADDGEYPVDFSAEKNVAWKVALPGVGSSTPAVWGDAIVVTCGIDGEDGVLCFGMDGRERWRRLLGPERPGKHPNGSGSNPSPVTDGKHVVVYFKSGTLACFDLDGNELWRTNLQQQYGKDTLWWDLATSPVLAGDRAIVAVMQADSSYLAAFDLATGDVLWKVPRQYQCKMESDQSYTTPQVVRIDGREQVVVFGADHLTGHDVEDGKLLWECGGFNPDQQQMWRTIASAAIDGDLAVVPYGRGSYLAGIRLGGEGDVTGSARLWQKEGRDIGADVPTPAIGKGVVYVLGDAGSVTCRDLETGDELWSGNLPKSRHRFYSSPVLAGDKLYAAREDGTVFVIGVRNGFEQLAENDMGESVIASPVPIDGGLVIRGREHLFRIEP